MHRPRKSALVAVQAVDPSHAALSRYRERAFMAVDASDIVACMAFLARGLTSDNSQPLEIGGAEREVVRMRALVGFTGVVVTAAQWIKIVLITGLELLKTLNFHAVVIQCIIETLTMLVALDGVFGILGRTDRFSQRLLCSLTGHL